MTRARAVEILKSTLAYDSDFAEAKQMAIEALEQEPTAEYSSDVISRQAVLNLAKEGKLLSGNIYKKASDYINELPSADRPTGHWIEDEKQNVLMRKFIEKGEVWRVCSVCGAGLMIGAEYETDKYYHETFHNYCPNCGADMRGGPTLTPEEFAEKMAGIAENGDEERKHVAADSIMCELLKSLGFGEGVGIFEDMDKWYS